MNRQSNVTLLQIQNKMPDNKNEEEEPGKKGLKVPTETNIEMKLLNVFCCWCCF